MKKVVLVFRGSSEAPVRNAMRELTGQISAKGWLVSVRKFWEGFKEDELLLIRLT